MKKILDAIVDSAETAKEKAKKDTVQKGGNGGDERETMEAKKAAPVKKNRRDIIVIEELTKASDKGAVATAHQERLREMIDKEFNGVSGQDTRSWNEYRMFVRGFLHAIFALVEGV